MPEKTLEEIVKSGVKLTPMMEQYYSIKKKCEADTLLLFRMGDFYELFFEDAVKASKLLNITLTHRGKLGDTKIPMSGIPHHAANTYIDRITSQGLKAAICEQIEDPKASRGIVKRAITQIVSPAMPFDLEKTKPYESRYIGCAFCATGTYFLVLVDFTTGEFIGQSFKHPEEFLDKLSLYAPKEFICFMGQWESDERVEHYLKTSQTLVTYLSAEYFTPKYTAIYTNKLIPAFEQDQIIAQAKNILAPIGALSYYICSTQAIENLYHIKPLRIISETGKLKVTLPTLIGIEILPKNPREYKNSLLGFFDKTKTCMGRRFLKNLFLDPVCDQGILNKRHSLVAFFTQATNQLESIRDHLGNIHDIEKIMAKTSASKVTPTDLLGLKTSIRAYQKIVYITQNIEADILKQLALTQMKVLDKLASTIENTINDEIGASLDKGNLIKTGHSKQRDRLASLHINFSQEMVKLESKFRNETNIAKLKIKSNNVNGYFIEVSKSASSRVPPSFIRRQTLVNCERYSCPELTSFEKEVVCAQDKLEKLERSIYQKLICEVADQSKLLLEMTHIISYLDAFCGLSWVALQEELTRPIFNTKVKKIINIQQGWHPLIKSIIKDQFVPHDLYLDQHCYFGLITGPNMAGKTTAMREVAIIQLLAQIGSFVPAKFAELGLCDYLFSRLGASDDITRGQSTFMMEMSETAEIVRHATNRSLIILDEIGRGTSTYDGLSIAWALVEHFTNKTCALTLFATHYHELIELVDKLSSAKNLTVETLNNDGDVQFLYRLIEQGATQSFGIFVAKLAGLPPSILKRSNQILSSLEEGSNNTQNLDSNLPLFASIPQHNSKLPLEKIPEYLSTLEKDLSKLDLMNMTPISALVKLQELKQSITLQ